MSRSSTRTATLAFALAIAGCGSFSPASDTPDASASPDGGGGGSSGGTLGPIGAPVVIGGAAFPDAVGVAVSADTIFISTGAAIYSRPKSDTVKDFGTPFVSNLSGSQYVALDPGRVFWAEYGTKTVSRIRQNGSDGVTVMSASQSSLNSPAGVAVAGEAVWVTDFAGNKLFSVAADASAAEVKFADVTLDGNPEGITAAGKTLYIALNTGGRIVSVESDNPIAAKHVVDAPGVAGLAFDEKTNALYYTSQAAPYGVHRWRDGMDKPERVAESESIPLGIALDDANVYWITRDGLTAKLWRATK